MDIEEIRNYCLKKKGVTESFPFDETTLVMKVKNKMFCLIALDLPHGINVKCDPDKAVELREKYEGVLPGYHMNKRLWNTIRINEIENSALIKEWIDDSYELVVNTLPRKVREELTNVD